MLGVRDAHVTGGGLLLSEGTRPGQLALAVYCQLEADVDDTLAAQAVKCLVHLSKDMMEADKTAGLLEPIQQEGLAVAASSGPGKGPAADAHLADAHFAHEGDLSASRQVPASREDQNGAQAADSEAESEGGEEQDRQQLGLDGAPGLTLQGLVRRMAKMAGDR